ncbi:MAG: hypothetical protein ACKOB8_15265 [Mycobacterium sp.]
MGSPTLNRPRSEWFAEFLYARKTAKPSPHTVAAYCRDFDRIAELVVGGPEVSAMTLQEVDIAALRPAFSRFADDHAPAQAGCRIARQAISAREPVSRGRLTVDHSWSSNGKWGR